MNQKILFRLLTVLLLALAIDILLVLPPLVASAAVPDDTSPVTSVEITPLTSPHRLAIYYGWPSYMNGAGGNITQALTIFTRFDVIVFGDGIEHPSHGDYTNTVAINDELRNSNIEVYGYIDLGVTTQNLDSVTISTYIDEWITAGASGIFFDDAGEDYGVTRLRLTSAVAYAHSQGLNVFVNAWNPDDVLSGATPLRAGDWYLAESHPVSNGQCPGLNEWWDKSHQLSAYRNQTGVRIATISTGDDGNCSKWSTYAPFRAALWGAYMFGFDAFGFTNPTYSASGPGADHLCPLPSFPTYAGAMYLGPPTGPIITTNAVTYYRLTDNGTIYVGEFDSGCTGGFATKVFLPLVLKTIQS